jgi:RWD domain/DRG Family Regulatory Proteins, Tma46
MNYQEEQAMEMEALAAIFGEQFEQKSTTECSVVTLPNAEVAHVSCYLDWVFPKTYPETIPVMSVRNIKGMNEKWSNELVEKLKVSANDFVGGPMIFSLVEIAKDWMTERNLPGIGEDSMHSKMLAQQHEQKRQQEKAAQQQQQSGDSSNSAASGQRKGFKKPDQGGTPVTVETFTKWMNALIKEDLITKPQAESASKLTGRQLFEKGNLKPEESDEIVAGDVEDFDRDLFLDEDVDPDLILEDDDDEAAGDGEEEETA